MHLHSTLPQSLHGELQALYVQEKTPQLYTILLCHQYRLGYWVTPNAIELHTTAISATFRIVRNAEYLKLEINFAMYDEGYTVH